jgi:hypothetical protein
VALASAAEDEPGWEYHVGSMGRHTFLLHCVRLLRDVVHNFPAAHFKVHFLIRRWLNGSSRLGEHTRFMFMTEFMYFRSGFLQFV